MEEFIEWLAALSVEDASETSQATDSQPHNTWLQSTDAKHASSQSADPSTHIQSPYLEARVTPTITPLERALETCLLVCPESSSSTTSCLKRVTLQCIWRVWDVAGPRKTRARSSGARVSGTPTHKTRRNELKIPRGERQSHKDAYEIPRDGSGRLINWCSLSI